MVITPSLYRHQWLPWQPFLATFILIFCLNSQLTVITLLSKILASLYISLFYRSVHDQPPQPTILFKSNRYHRGSIYCIAWSATGDIIATGSNDKSIKMMKFDVETCSVTWPGLELAIHSGTVRDLAFVSRASGTPVLVSGGAGTDEDSIERRSVM